MVMQILAAPVISAFQHPEVVTPRVTVGWVSVAILRAIMLLPRVTVLTQSMKSLMSRYPNADFQPWNRKQPDEGW
jgi:hypothetical protein